MSIKYHGPTGLTVYARVQTGASTFVAAALTEGSSGGLGVYEVGDAALVSAGVNAASSGNGFPYTIRSGSPSTTANDQIVGDGVLPWSGSVEMPASANVTQISGDATAADNLETAADGGSYNLGGGAIVSASVTGAVGSVAGNVGGNVAGNVVGSVGSVTGGINTGSGVITTLDALDTAQDAQHATTKGVADAIQAKTDNLPSDPADASVVSAATDALATLIGEVPTNAELAARTLAAADYATATAVGDLPTNAELATALGTADDAVLAALATVDANVDAILVDTAAIQPQVDYLYGKRPDGEQKFAGADDLEALEIATTSQPRVNYPPDVTLKLSPRNDGTHKAYPPVRIRPGAVERLAVGVDMSPRYPGQNVQDVAAPTSPLTGSSITAEDLGPRDWVAMVELAGTAVAGEERECTFNVTMERGATVKVTFDVVVMDD